MKTYDRSDKYVNSDITSVNYKSNIVKVNHNNETFRYLSIYDSNIEDSDFSKSTHIFTNFNQVIVTDTLFKEIITGGCRFNFTIFTNVDFSNSNLKYVNFDFSQLNDVNFSNCNLQNASFVATSFTRTKFINANLENSIFGDNNLVTNFTDHNSTKASFKCTDFDKANLIGSNLITEGDLREVNPMYADVSNAILDKPSLIRLIDYLKDELKSSKFIISDEKGLREMPVSTEYSKHKTAKITNFEDKLASLLSLEELVHHNEIDVLGSSVDINHIGQTYE